MLGADLDEKRLERPVVLHVTFLLLALHLIEWRQRDVEVIDSLARRDIGRFLDGLPVTAYRENIFERAARLVSRNRVAVVLVLAYLFMRLLFILFSRH